MLNLDQPKYATVSATAKYLCVNVDTVRAWFDNGDLEGMRTPGGERRVSLASIEALEEKHASGVKRTASRTRGQITRAIGEQARNELRQPQTKG